MSAVTGMTREQLIVGMLVRAPWLNEQQANALLDGTDEERELIVRSRATATIEEGPSVWDDLLAFLMAAGTVAGAVTGIGSAITTVYSIGKL